MRKWNLRFDGQKDPVCFLERLEEFVVSYSLSRQDILKALPELLTSSALLWYRNSRHLWVDYNGFRHNFEIQFFPLGYHLNLDEEIRKRTQGKSESFRSFVVAVGTLIRRSGSFSEVGKIDLFYCIMRPDYKLFVRRQDFSSLPQIIDRAEHYEAYFRKNARFSPHLPLLCRWRPPKRKP